MKKNIPIVLIVLLLRFTTSAWAAWVQDGGSLNVDFGVNATQPSLAFSHEVPYVAWSENNNQFRGLHIYMKHWNGSDWQQDGSGLLDIYSFGPTADNINLANMNENLAVTWRQAVDVGNYNFTTSICTSLWNGTAWYGLGGADGMDGMYGNIVAAAPRSAFGDYCYVAYLKQEYSGARQIYVKQFNGSGWTQTGDTLNGVTDMSVGNPAIAAAPGLLYAAWSESGKMYVKQWNGTAWQLTGGSLNIDVGQTATASSLALCNGVPYIAWTEGGNLYVKHWISSVWQKDGDALNRIAQNASSPSLAISNGVPYVAWSEGGKMYMSHWNATAWQPDGDVININANHNATNPSLVISQGIPYLSWSEPDGANHMQVYVKHYQQELTSGQAAAVVIGQADMTHNAANQGNLAAGMNTLCGPESIDAKGNKVFIADNYNKRVLIYNAIPSTNNTSADATLSTLGYCPGVACDGSRLYVDAFNGTSTDSQIWRYNQIPDHLGPQPDADQLIKTFTYSRSVFCDGEKFYTYGATEGLFAYDATTLTYVRCAQQVSIPRPDTNNNSEGVAGDGARLFLADRGFNRILIWKQIPATNNAPADVAVGQASLYEGQANQNGSCAANTLSNPRGVFSDGSRLYVADSGNNRVLIFDPIPTSHNAYASTVIGQPDMFHNLVNQGGSVTAQTLSNPSRVFRDGSRLYISDTGNNRVLIYYMDPLPTGTPTVILTQTATLTPSLTPTPTMISTATPTKAATFIPTLSATATRTPIPTPSLTVTLIPTPVTTEGSAYPNPFLPTMGQKAKINLQSAKPYVIKIMNLKGEKVRVLNNENEWDGRDENGQWCKGGLYIYQIETLGRRMFGKLVLIK